MQSKFNKIYESVMKTLIKESALDKVKPDEFTKKCDALKDKTAEEFIPEVNDVQLVDDSDFQSE